METQNIDPLELEFLKHSNWIEKEYSEEALEDAHLAWEYLKKKDITLETILTTHLLLMRRLDKEIAGKIRDCDVWIGGEKKIFVAEKLIRDDLENLCDAISASRKLSSQREKVTKAMHIDFERLHPFVDGNGRVGRLVWQRHRMMLGLPIKVIHEGEEQEKYYEWFQ